MEPINKICLIDAGLSPEGSSFGRLNKLVAELKEQGHQVQSIRLTTKKIIPCTGCWGCWVKTPGVCLFEDDSKAIRTAVIQSDLVLFASPLLLGYPLSSLKHLFDKLIPLLLPYIELVENENHHVSRYEAYPALGFLFEKELDTDSEDLEILLDLLKRMALNFKSSLDYFIDLDDFPFGKSLWSLDGVQQNSTSKIA